jgi:hypothetical protein
MAADSSGNIFAVTGNGGPGTFDGNYAIQESVVELGAELKSVESLFTPSDSDTHDVGVNDMDSKDGDLGSGGVMLLPDQPGSIPHLAVVQGKIGPMYLLNRDKRGRYRTEDAVAELSSDWGCWCGPSYFASSDGGFVVSSTGTTLAIWKVQTSPTVNLIKQSAYAKLTSVQDRGFMTSVSSHDGLASSTVVWAVPHAATWNKSNPSPNLTLYAFSAADASNPIFQAPAGYWLNLNGNANVVPVVANGKVFVASYRTLAVFGLDGYASLGPAPPLVRVRDLQEHEIYGRVESVSGHQITVRTRSGDLVRVDTTIAASGHHLAFHGVGGAVSVRGNYDASGVLAAQSISRAKSSPGAWEPDR